VIIDEQTFDRMDEISFGLGFGLFCFGVVLVCFELDLESLVLVLVLEMIFL
jgi:hypothetical protein